MKKNQRLLSCKTGVFINLCRSGGLSLLFTFSLLFTQSVTVNAQISGLVFRDFNGNGTRENTTGTFVEPLSPGVVVTAYNSSDVIVASYTTTVVGTANYTIPVTGSAYNGTLGSNTGFVANGTAVRLEFTIPNSIACLVNGLYDFASKSGKTYGTSVRFVATAAAARTGNNFALNNPNDYVAGTTATTFLFQAVQFNGNPTAASGTSTTQNALVKYPYNSSGVTALTAAQILASAAQIGSVYGVAYSKYAKKVFTSAYMKRHSGFGPSNGTFNNAPGSIYIVDPNLSSTTTTKAASYFLSLDALGYPTHNATGTPVWGSGTSYNLSTNGNATANLRTETVSYPSAAALGVIGTNTVRGLSGTKSDPSNDPAAFGQIGRVSLGSIEMSDDGKFLFVVNLFDRKVYQLQLNSITSPTAATYVNSWSLPNPPARSASGLTGAAATYTSETAAFYDGTRGLQRPFALKYYRGKLYVGAVTTGEGTGAVSTTDDNTGNVEFTDLWSYVWELTPSVGFSNTTPILQFPLNYNKGQNTDGYNETWKPWTNTLPASFTTGFGNQWSATQPMFTGIEFDVDGTMIIALRDRSGDQGGYANYMLSSTTSRTAMAFGDQLRAYKNPTGCAYQLETNAKEGAASSKAATAGAGNGQGPGGGEFYFQDGVEMFNGTANSGRYHYNTAMGGLAFLPGMEEVTATYMDPLATWSGGPSWMNSNDGTNTRDFQVYVGNAVGDLGKANGLGDIEMLTVNPPIEIGNRIWRDTNADGIQGADEVGIAGVLLELVDASGNAVDGDVTVSGVQATYVTTDATGNWYITSDTGTDATGINYNVDLESNTNYTVRLATSTTGNDWDPTVNGGSGGPRAGGDLVGLTLTVANKAGNGAANLSDSDASSVSGVPQMSITTGIYGQNDHSLDIGFAPGVNVGNKVWIDINNNGVFDSGELPLAGATVKLYAASATDGVPATPATPIATVTTDASGYYLFDNLLPGDYVVSVMNPAGYISSTVNAASANNNIDNDDNGVRTASGETFSNTITLSVGGEPTGETPSNNTANNVADNSSNLTLDFGFIAVVNVGNKVWIDANNNGIFDSGESPLVGATVKLYVASTTDGVPATPATPLATATTDATGYYLFDNLIPGNYVVSVMNPVGYISSTVNAASANNDTDNDDNGVRTSSGETFSNTITLTVGGEPTGETPSTNPAGNIADNSSNLTLDFGFVAAVNLGNKVWIDVNNNGLFDTGESPLVGATVKLYVASGTDGIPVTPATPLATVTTDANGYYLFDNLIPGNYVVSVMNPAGYTSSTVNASSANNNIDNDDNGVRTLNGETFSNTITLAAGTEPTGETPSNNPAGNIADNSSNLTLDFGFVAAVNLGNKVWIDVNNNGLFDSGESPLVGATVKLYVASATDGIPVTPATPLATVTTDANGYYLFDNLIPGSYVVSVMNPAGYTSSTVNAASANNNIDNDDNGVRTLNGETFSNTITLAVSTAPTGETPSTNPAGNIADNSSNLTLDFGFVAAVNLGNKVWIDANNNGLFESTEAAVPTGTVVKLYVASSTDGVPLTPSTPLATTTTDGTGYYLFDNLIPGNYVVSVMNPTGYVSSTINAASANNDVDNDDNGVRTVSGETFSNTITLTVGGEPTGETPSNNPAGNIVDNSSNLTLDFGFALATVNLGNKVWIDVNNNGLFESTEAAVPAGTMVKLYVASATDGVPSTPSTPLATTTTDANGYYLFNNLAPGNYVVSVMNPAGYTSSTVNAASANNDVDNDDNGVRTVSGETFSSTITLTVGGEPTGETPNTNPAGNIADNSSNLTLDFGFVAAVNVGNKVWIDANKNGLFDSGELAIQTGTVVKLYIASATNGVPLTPASPLATTTTDANGYYLFDNLVPGNYVISVMNPVNFGSSPVNALDPNNKVDNDDNGVRTVNGETFSNTVTLAIGTAPTGETPNTNPAGNIADNNSNLTVDFGFYNNSLPVTLVNFNGKAVEKQSVLSWNTTAETNSAYFEVQRSTDGKNWTALGNVLAKGESSETLSYGFTDGVPLNGENLYRLKMVDLDQTYAYSRIISIKLEVGYKLSVFPNPTSDLVKIETSNGASVQKVEVYSLIGKLVKEVVSPKGGEISVQQLPSGMYMLRITTSNGSVETRKVVVVR